MTEEDNLLNGGYLEFLSTILSGIVSPHDANAAAVTDGILSRPQMKEEK